MHVKQHPKRVLLQ